MSRLIASDRPQEVDLPEGWPMRIAEVELRIGALPEHEAREPHLSARANDQIGVWAIMRVQILVQGVRAQASQNLVGC